MISINSYFPNAYIEVEKYLSNNLKNIINSKRAIIFLCIGTDRSSGDSLGPLIGYKLKSIKNSKFYIYGSLENPIHSLNIEQIIEKIYASFKDPFIIAIDASLGDAKNVGKTSFTASKVKSFGALSFSTMIVITIANTPSLKASILPLLIILFLVVRINTLLFL